MSLESRVALALAVFLLPHVDGQADQASPTRLALPSRAGALPLGVQIARDVRSGEAHQYEMTATAGDLVSGTIGLRGVAAIVQVADASGNVVRTHYVSGSAAPEPARLGFVASGTGVYRLQISAFDRFDGGSQVNPGEPVPVTGSAAGSYTLRLDAASVSARMTALSQSPERITRARASSASRRIPRRDAATPSTRSGRRSVARGP